MCYPGKSVVGLARAMVIEVLRPIRCLTVPMLHAMAAEPAYQRIPVIMMSSLSRGRDRPKM
jgi:hypothetical protein